MLFYEPLFLFLFLPVVFAAFLLTPKAGRAGVLLAASLLFYLWSQPLFVPQVLLTCVTDVLLARQIAQGGRSARPALWCGVAINLGLLVWYKYAGFAVGNLDAALGELGLPGIRLAAIALPVGVSFIVFEKITYLVDVARGRSRPALFRTYLLYVFLFPKLLAGPIVKYHEIEAQLSAGGGDVGIDDRLQGFGRFMLGVVKKTVLADTLGAGADMVFAADPHRLGSGGAWLGVLCFAFQVYIDFSAYSDMAIGLARLFGFRLRENFDRPYIACSITEFWRRWHISLTSWIREYLYIPLGGNRVPVWRTYANLWLCFLASGLWHGAAWTYVAWGAYNGVFLVLDRLFLLRLLDRLPRVLANAITFAVVLVGWTLFRAGSLAQAGSLLAAMAQPGLANRGAALWLTPPMQAALAAATLVSFLPRVPGFDAAARAALTRPAGRLAANTILLPLFVFGVAMALANPFKPFLYFRF